ncbi:hypothetical protein V6N11_069785 [Hibiscus sabdariffa]|uniref:Uncharacterized protein n=1 Tax=Hibiscus sabdariffa TaxID=183260 RepID=A0ABR2Q3U0_9ROSI
MESSVEHVLRSCPIVASIWSRVVRPSKLQEFNALPFDVCSRRDDATLSWTRILLSRRICSIDALEWRLSSACARVKLETGNVEVGKIILGALKALPENGMVEGIHDMLSREWCITVNRVPRDE